MNNFLIAISYETAEKFKPEAIIWCLCAGAVIAGFLSMYDKRYIGRLIRAIDKKGARDEQSAATFDELSIKNTFLYRRALRSSSAMRKYVKIANEDEIKTERESRKIERFFRKVFASDTTVVKYDYSRARLYIPEDKTDAAVIRYRQRGTNIAAFIIGAALLIAASYAAVKLYPQLIEMAKSTFGKE